MHQRLKKSADVIMEIQGRQTIINSPNRGIQDVKNISQVVNENAYVMTGKIWRGGGVVS